MAAERKTQSGGSIQKHDLLCVPAFDAWLVEDLDCIPGRTGIGLQYIFQHREFLDTCDEKEISRELLDAERIARVEFEC